MKVTSRQLIIAVGALVLLALIAVGAVLITRQNAPKAAPVSFSQTTNTSAYRMLLTVAPPQTMWTQAQVSIQHPTNGEVMFTGTMAMPPGMSGMTTMAGSDYPPGWYHVEVHVYDRASGAVVKDAAPVIAIHDDTSGKTTSLPIVTMQSVTDGGPDFHYGNNVQLQAGDAFTLTTQVGSDVGTFHFHL